MTATHDVISIGSMCVGAVAPVLTLWLRLRFQLRRERERSDYLRLATTLPAGSRVQEQRGDGTRLTIDVGTAAGRDEP